MRTNFMTVLMLTAGLITTFSESALAAEGELKITSGVDYSSGDYGAAIDTDILYIPFSVKYSKGEWAFNVSTGYIQLEGPGGVFPGGDIGPIIAPDRRRIAAIDVSGIGDTYFSVTYSPEIESDPNLFLDLTVKVKVPTASESKSLGTGKTDFTFQGDLAKLFGDFMPFGTVGYRVVGNPSDFQLNNVFFGSLGAAYYFTPRISLGSSYDFRQASSPLSVDGHEIFTYLNIQSRERWGVSLYTVVGLSDNSPDLALGLQVTLKAF